MNKDLKVYKSYTISGVVITLENFRELSNIIYKEYERDSKNKKHTSIKFISKSSDNTRYESSEKDIFLEGGFLDLKRIIAIEMYYNNYEDDKSISIDIEQSTRKKFIGNEVSVSGHNEVWVNGVIKSIESCSSNWKKQVYWPYKFKWPLIILFAIGIGLLYLNFLEFMFRYVIVLQKVVPKPEWVISFRPVLMFIYYLAGFAFAYMPASYIVSKICELYPKVELDIGPEHLNKEKIKRKKLYIIVFVGLVPLIIAIIIELIKSLTNHIF